MVDALVASFRQQHVPMTTPVLARHRATTHAQVAICTRCAISTLGQGPVCFSARGAATSLCAVVGEAPGPDEDRRGVPFVGKSGKLLRAMMQEANIEPEDCLFTNAVSCFPQDITTAAKGKIRQPTAGELLSCRDNLLAQVKAANSKYVLLVGAVATKQWRDDLRLGDVVGGFFVWDSTYIVMPIYHPAAILRGGGRYRTDNANALRKFGECIHSADGVPIPFGTRCVVCKAMVEEYDVDAVPYCRAHYIKYKDAWRKTRSKYGKFSPGFQMELGI